MSMVQQMAGIQQNGWPLDSIGWMAQWTTQPTEQTWLPSVIPNVEQKGLPNVTTPTTPWINNMNPAQKAMM
jgi:hypothetical protein